MKIITAHSAKYNRDGTIDCIVIFDNGLGEGAYTASPSDSAEHGVRLFKELSSGVHGNVAPYTDKDAARDKQAAAEHERLQLIDEASEIIRPLSDERDAEIISDDDLERWKAWVAYRKTLRAIDVTATNIEWPAKPE